MADLFLVRERLKLMLWFVGAGVAGGTGMVWHERQQLGLGGAESRFLLAAAVTGALALAWVAVLVLFLSARRIMEPHVDSGRWSRIPWWLIRCLGLCVLIAAMAAVLRNYSGRGEDVFTLLEEGQLALLEERIVEQPGLLEKKHIKSGLTLLEGALQSANVEAVDMLLAQGGGLDAAGEGKNMVLAVLGNPLLLETLLRHGADPDVQDADGLSPLHHAVAAGNTNALKLLAEAGAHVNVRDPLYRTPLLQAVMKDDLATAGVLLQLGANPDQRDKRGDTAMHKAVQGGKTEAVCFLLERGADATIFNDEEMAPVHIAARNGRDELIETFAARPELLELRSEDDRTAFDHALQGRRYETARRLLELGADIDRVRENGYTALHLMLIARDYKSARFLVEQGANAHLAHPGGETAYELMRTKQLQTLLDLLEVRDNPHESATDTGEPADALTPDDS
jgi:ankyrin repeat protein